MPDSADGPGWVRTSSTVGSLPMQVMSTIWRGEGEDRSPCARIVLVVSIPTEQAGTTVALTESAPRDVCGGAASIAASGASRTEAPSKA